MSTWTAILSKNHGVFSKKLGLVTTAPANKKTKAGDFFSGFFEI
jgi:hypothetical protein